MTKTRLWLILGAALLVRPPGVPAAEEAINLSLESCITLGLASSRTLRSGLSAVAAGQAAVREAKAGRFPRLALAAAYNRLSEEEAAAIDLPAGELVLAEPVVSSTVFSASLTQLLFNGFRLASAIRGNEQAAEESRYHYQHAREALIFELQAAYWQLAGAIELEAVIRENLERVQAHRRETSLRFEQGVVTYNDLLKVEMQLADSELRLIDGEIGRRLAAARLNTLLGNEPGRQLRLHYSLEELPPRAGSLEDAVTEALSRRADLLALRSHARVQEAVLQTVRSGWYPEFFLSGSAAVARPNPRLFPPTDRFEASWELGLGAVLQVGSWPGLPARIERAAATLEQVQNSRADLTAAIRLEVIEKTLDYSRRCQRIGLAEKMTRQAEENLRITREKADAGLALTSELLDAGQALLEADLRLTQSRIEARIGWAALLQVRGCGLETE
jgi:outer membrane protein